LSDLIGAKRCFGIISKKGVDQVATHDELGLSFLAEVVTSSVRGGIVWVPVIQSCR